MGIRFGMNVGVGVFIPFVDKKITLVDGQQSTLHKIETSVLDLTNLQSIVEDKSHDGDMLMKLDGDGYINMLDAHFLYGDLVHIAKAHHRDRNQLLMCDALKIQHCKHNNTKGVFVYYEIDSLYDSDVIEFLTDNRFNDKYKRGNGIEFAEPVSIEYHISQENRHATYYKRQHIDGDELKGDAAFMAKMYYQHVVWGLNNRFYDGGFAQLERAKHVYYILHDMLNVDIKPQDFRYALMWGWD